MLRITLSLFLTFFCLPFLNAQYVEVIYRATIKTLDGAALSGQNRLIFNLDTAIFIHDEYPKESTYKTEGTTVNYTKGDPYGRPILTVRSTGVQLSKEQYFAGKSMYFLEDSIPDIDWKISQEIVEKNGLQQQKAVGEYGGRIYTVWFAPEIPYPFGPHRLGGLPGVIISANSSDGYVTYEFSGLRKISKENGVSNFFAMGSGNIISYEALKKYVIKRLFQSEALSSGELKVTASDPAENYTIEKNRWHIISDHKKERGY